MKLVSLVLAAASVLASASAFAEVKQDGTLIPSLCGSTPTFPVSTTVCVVTVQGSDDLYLGLGGVRTEIFMPEPKPFGSDLSYAFVKSVKKEGQKTIYTAVMANSESNLQTTYTLTVTEQNGSSVGALQINGGFIFGGEHIEMDIMAVTL